MKIAVIGGGASGCLLAGLLAQAGSSDRQWQVSLYEASGQLMRKLAATGNGRCNFTNVHLSPDHYTGGSSGFVEKTVSRYGHEEIRNFFSGLGLPSLSLESGMTYPRTMMASSMIRAIGRWLADLPVHIVLSSRLVGLEKLSETGKRGNYRLSFEDGQNREADLVVLSTGGGYGIGKKEWSEGYSLAKQLGHTISRLHPGIVALRLEEADFCKKLAGLKLAARIDIAGTDRSFQDDLLFTDYGISGIAVLMASNDILDRMEEGGGGRILVDLLPDYSRREAEDYVLSLKRAHPTWTPADLFTGLLPEDLIQALAEKSSGSLHIEGLNLPAGRSFQEEDLTGMVTKIKKLPFTVIGARKNDRGQISCGGINRREIDGERLESKLADNVFFTGEIMDVQGECGGYNLHWAWASAFQVNQAIRERFLR